MIMQEMIELKTELDRLMNSLSGILAARTVLNDEDQIIEIHILSDMSKSPKQLVRDVQSAVMAGLGLEIDYKLISIAQVGKDLVVPINSVPKVDTRLSIQKIMLSLESNSFETVVILGRNDEKYEGSYRSPLSSRNRAAAAANAGLVALRLYLGESSQLNLVDFQRHTLGGQDCFLAAVSYQAADQESLLMGIASIQSAELEVQSAVMAVLSAMNRPLGKQKM